MYIWSVSILGTVYSPIIELSGRYWGIVNGKPVVLMSQRTEKDPPRMLAPASPNGWYIVEKGNSEAISMLNQGESCLEHLVGALMVENSELRHSVHVLQDRLKTIEQTLASLVSAPPVLQVGTPIPSVQRIILQKPKNQNDHQSGAGALLPAPSHTAGASTSLISTPAKEDSGASKAGERATNEFFKLHYFRKFKGASKEANSLAVLKAASLGRIDVLNWLVTSGGLSLEERDPMTFHTAVHEAGLRGDLRTLELLQALGANISAVNASGHNVAHLAALQNLGDVLTWLVHHTNVPMLQLDANRCSIVHLAAKRGHWDLVRWIHETVPGVSLADADSDGITIAHWAARDGELDILSWIEDVAGRDALTAQDANHWNLAFYASAAQQTRVVDWLIRKDVPVNQPARNGQTPAHSAVFNGNLALIKLLFNAGADLTKLDSSGYAPVHLAVQQGRVDIWLWMKASGINTKVQTSKGQYATDLAPPRLKSIFV